MFGFGGGEDTEHTSGLQRLLSSILCAVCGFPIVLIGGTILLGYNEKRDVCEQAAILSGEDAYKPVGCTDASTEAGSLVFFSCQLLTSSITPGSYQGLTAGAFSNIVSTYVGTGIRIESEMDQCVETSESQKDSVGGGTTTVYSYRREWRNTAVDSSAFRDRNKANSQCRGLNPPWPTQVPKTGSYYAPSAKADVWTLTPALLQRVPLNTAITGTAPTGWTSSSNTFTTGQYRIDTVNSDTPGSMRVKLYGTDWQAASTVTVLGQNDAGTIQTWTAPDSWLCSGYTLLDLRTGTLTIAEVWEAMRAESSIMTWILRILGFAICWVAFCLLAGPLEVAADCIPCIGPCLGDAIQAVACIVSCLPATACCVGVVGVVWVAMRPMIGIPLLLVFAAIMTAMIVWKLNWSKKGKPSESGDLVQGTVVGSSYSGPVHEPVAHSFLNALRQEYVYGQQGAVGQFFESVPNAEQYLQAYEEQVRSSGDPSATITQLGRDWGVRGSE